MEHTVIEQVFLRNLISTVVTLAIAAVIFFFIRWAVRHEVLPKWSYAIYAVIAGVAAILLCVGLLQIHLDIVNQDYVTYTGTYLERSGSQSGLKTVVVYDEAGKEIRLLRTGSGKKGEYNGTVIYGKRSRIVVTYSGSPTA